MSIDTQKNNVVNPVGVIYSEEMHGYYLYPNLYLFG